MAPHHTEPETYQTSSCFNLMDQIFCQINPSNKCKYQHVNGIFEKMLRYHWLICLLHLWRDWICQRKVWVQDNSLVLSDVHDGWSQALCVWYCWLYAYSYTCTIFIIYIYIYYIHAKLFNLACVDPPCFMHHFLPQWSKKVLVVWFVLLQSGCHFVSRYI